MKPKKITVATLGPQGTFSHQVSRNVINYLKHHVDEVELEFENTISKCFRLANNGIDIVVVPLENSIAGSIGTSMDNIIKYNKAGMQIVAEIDLKIEHFLTGFGSMETIKTLYVHPQAFAQCEQYLEVKLPKVEIIYTSSNAQSAQNVADLHSKEVAAIVPEICLEIYNIPKIAENIEDSNFNSTRFIVTSSKEYVKPIFDSRIKSKSTLLIDPRDDRPGLLHDILNVFAEHMINLTKIESRPSKKRLGDYVFYIDIQADISHPALEGCLKELQKTAHVRNLGSYNRIN